MRSLRVQCLVLATLTVGTLFLSCGDDNKVPGMPVADAGFDRTVAASVEARLDGSGSHDVDGKTLTYAWTLVSRPTDSVAELIAANTVEPVINPDRGGTYLVSLVVNNGQRASRPDTLVLTVFGGSDNLPPIASAKCAPADCKIKHGTTSPTTAGVAVFKLNGTDSYDPNGDAISTYTWTQITNSANCGQCTNVGFTCAPTVSLPADFNGTSANAIAEIEAPLAVGIMVFRLEVQDAGALTGSTCISVESTNNAPLSIINPPSGNPAAVDEGTVIGLDGGGSGDTDLVDVPSVTYAWTHSPATVLVDYAPNATTAAVTATVHDLTVDTDVTFTLTVSDSFDASDACAAPSAACGRTCCGAVMVPVRNIP